MNIKPETVYREIGIEDFPPTDHIDRGGKRTYLKETKDVYCFSADELKEVLENAFNAGREIDKDQDVIYDNYEEYGTSLNIK
jgi:hypothetical protein